MASATLFSTLGSNQNQAGPPVPALTVVDAGGVVERATFTLTVTPSTGWAEAWINWGPDNINYPGQYAIFSAPTGGGTVTETKRIHGANQSPNAGGGLDGARYFKAELVKIAPSCTATLTMSY